MFKSAALPADFSAVLQGKGASEIVRILAEDDVKVSRWSISKFLKRHQERKSLENAPQSGRPAAEVSVEMMNLLDPEKERRDGLPQN